MQRARFTERLAYVRQRKPSLFPQDARLITVSCIPIRTCAIPPAAPEVMSLTESRAVVPMVAIGDAVVKLRKGAGQQKLGGSDKPSKTDTHGASKL